MLWAAALKSEEGKEMEAIEREPRMGIIAKMVLLREKTSRAHT